MNLLSQTTIQSSGFPSDQSHGYPLYAPSEQSIGQSFVASVDGDIISLSIKADVLNANTGSVNLKIGQNPPDGSLLSSSILSTEMITSVNMNGVITFDLSGAPFPITNGTIYRFEIGTTNLGSDILRIDYTANSNIYSDGVFYNNFGNPFSNADINFSITIDNGTIPVNSNPIPTLGEWGLIVLSMGLLIFGLVVLREKRAQSSPR